MNDSIKRFLKPYILRVVRYVLDDLAEEILKDMERVEGEKQAAEFEAMRQEINACGTGVTLHPTVQITDPISVILGNNVHVGANTVFISEGGLTIGDHTFIGSDVRIYTHDVNVNGETLPYDHRGIPKPVEIGRYVYIGEGSRILPGVKIGDGAVIDRWSVVRENVPAFGNSNTNIWKTSIERDENVCRILEKNRHFCDGEGRKLAPETLSTFLRGGESIRDDIFFIPSSGRAGSKTIAAVLSQHPDITCIHERFPQLIRLSSEYAYGEKNREQVEAELRAIYVNSLTYPAGFYGESDQKLFNLVPILADIFPSAKFIWQVRDGRKVVTSYASHERGIFAHDEHEQGSPVVRGWRRWAFYRLDGSRCGAFTKEEWDKLSRFERACWFWNYVNTEIEQHMKQLAPDRWMLMKLETLGEQVPEVYNFLGATPQPTEILHVNKAWYPTKTDWSDEQKAQFEKWCGAMMDRLYPNWRG